MSQKIKVGIIGLGMVGDPVRRWFEEHLKYQRNKELYCYDADPKKSYSDDINKAEIIFVAVPTPFNHDGSCNTSIVESVIKNINDGKIIVIKSTVPPGTVERLQQKYPKKKFIFNPEFLTESQAWLDYIKPDRQIVAPTVKSHSDAKEILMLLPKAHFERPWSSDYTKKSINATEAELTKYASNVFGYIKVIYGNMLADVCHALNIDFGARGINAKISYDNVREMIGADPRIGSAWLNVEQGSYCGAGGYCFPKDMSAFTSFIKSLTNDIEKQAVSRDMGAIKSLKKAVIILEAIADYNEHLLSWQGLTLADVSMHNQEILLTKRKSIRSDASEEQSDIPKKIKTASSKKK